MGSRPSPVLLIVPDGDARGDDPLADMVQVFVLNVTYDIGLKLISFHRSRSLVLLAPDPSARADVPAEPSCR